MRSLAGRVGRVAIWFAIALLLVRGLGAVLSPSSPTAASAPVSPPAEDTAAAALAVRFARTYISNPAPAPSASLLAEGVRLGGGRPAPGGPVAVTQAEVSAARAVGGGEAIFTVTCELRDGRVLDLAVPVSRSGAGEAAVSAVPWIVAVPSVAGPAERPRPLAGPGAAAIRALAERFLPAYLAARSARELSYMLAPGAAVLPLGGELRPLGSAGSVSQLGDGEGPHRTILVAGRFEDVASGAAYPLAYRLAVTCHGRWYVRSVEGGSS